jgi:hypothetical protein
MVIPVMDGQQHILILTMDVEEQVLALLIPIILVVHKNAI